MRETSFIKQNKEKWKEFEQILENKNKDPDKLNELFVQITDDLSYSRTFYPNRSVRVYLNNLAQRIFTSIYKNKKSRKNRLVHFWTDTLPQLVYESRKEFRLSLIIFTLAFIIGAFSSAMDPEFARVILGDDYIDMTLENIQSGDPMNVYKQRGQFGMSLGITANNLYVAFLTFVLGAFFAIGSIMIMISNGIMVGAFQYFFYEQGLLRESFLTIWIHGTLEISAIIIAGAAGITMGKGLLFPGTFRRIQAFQISAKRGLMIMLGITPIIITAGFIEGFLTRHTETPDILRAAFILICLFFILGYFVWYPRLKAKQGFSNSNTFNKVPPDTKLKINFYTIYSTGEIFSNIFILYRRYFGKVILASFLTAVLYCLLCFSTASVLPDELFSFSSGGSGGALQLFYNDMLPFLSLIILPLLSGLSMLVFHQVNRLAQEQPKRSSVKKLVVDFLSISLILAGFYYLFGQMDLFADDSSLLTSPMLTLVFQFFALLLLANLLPVVLIWAYVAVTEQKNVISSLGRTYQLLRQNFLKTLTLYLILLLLGFLFYALSDTAIVYFYFEFIGWNLALPKEILDQVSAILLTFVNIFTWLMVFNMLLLGASLLYYTLKEVNTAIGLAEAAAHIGGGRRIQGLEQESIKA